MYESLKEYICIFIYGDIYTYIIRIYVTLKSLPNARHTPYARQDTQIEYPASVV